MTGQTLLTEADEQTAPDTRTRHLVVRLRGRKAPTTDAVITQKQPGHLRPFIENDDDPGPATAGIHTPLPRHSSR
jgi:hypothetical protein